MWSPCLSLPANSSPSKSNHTAFLCILKESLSRHDFIASGIGHLENTALLSESYVLKADTLHYTTQKEKRDLLMYYWSHQTRPSILGICQALRILFLILFFFKKLRNPRFTIGNQYSQLFSFKWQASLLIFEKKPAKCPSLNNHSLFGICSFQKKTVFQEKGD